MDDHDVASRAVPGPGWYPDGTGAVRWWDGRQWAPYGDVLADAPRSAGRRGRRPEGRALLAVACGVVALLAVVAVVVGVRVSQHGGAADRGDDGTTLTDHGADADGIAVVAGVPDLGHAKPAGYVDRSGDFPVVPAQACWWSDAEIAATSSATAAGYLRALNRHDVAWAAVSNDIAATAQYYRNAVLLEAKTTGEFADDLTTLSHTAPPAAQALLTQQITTLHAQVDYLLRLAAEMSGGAHVDHAYGASLWNQRSERAGQIRAALGLPPSKCPFNRPV